jgi:hypothetical protein
MAEIRIEKELNELILYFGTKQKAINAYTLASTLVSIADAIKEANLQVNPGYDVEVLITDLGSGSFKAVIKTIFTNTKNLFSKENLKTVALGILTTFLYEQYFATKPNIIVNVSPEYTVIEQADERIVIHNDVYQATKEITKSQPKFQNKISTAMKILQQDEEIESIALVQSLEEEPEIVIPRDNFKDFIIEKESEVDEEAESPIVEKATLQITRAILENNGRKWEFIWHGQRIPAPILDDAFYKNFSEHRIEIAPGDTLEVRLKIYRRKIEGTEIYENKKYEVVHVEDHHRLAAGEELFK